MTLVEVLAALLILGSLLVSVVVGRNRLLNQFHVAQRRSQAVHAADKLLAIWWKDPSRLVPRSGQGPVEGSNDLSWRTQIVYRSSAEELGGQIVRLQLLGRSEQDRRVDGQGSVLVSVDVVVPHEAAPSNNP